MLEQVLGALLRFLRQHLTEPQRFQQLAVGVVKLALQRLWMGWHGYVRESQGKQGPQGVGKAATHRQELLDAHLFVAVRVHGGEVAVHDLRVVGDGKLHTHLARLVQSVLELVP